MSQDTKQHATAKPVVLVEVTLQGKRTLYEPEVALSLYHELGTTLAAMELLKGPELSEAGDKNPET